LDVWRPPAGGPYSYRGGDCLFTHRFRAWPDDAPAAVGFQAPGPGRRGTAQSRIKAQPINARPLRRRRGLPFLTSFTQLPRKLKTADRTRRGKRSRPEGSSRHASAKGGGEAAAMPIRDTWQMLVRRLRPARLRRRKCCGRCFRAPCAGRARLLVRVIDLMVVHKERPAAPRSKRRLPTDSGEGKTADGGIVIVEGAGLDSRRWRRPLFWPRRISGRSTRRSERKLRASDPWLPSSTPMGRIGRRRTRSGRPDGAPRPRDAGILRRLAARRVHRP